MFATLEGFAFGTKSPAYFGCFGPDLERWIAEEMSRPQVVLMGRVTYETLAAHASDADPLTNAAKIVFSGTLREPRWPNTRLIDADLSDAITALKDKPGPPMRTMGSLSLVASLLHLGAVDRMARRLPPDPRRHRPRADLRGRSRREPRAHQHHDPRRAPGAARVPTGRVARHPSNGREDPSEPISFRLVRRCP